MAVEDVAGIGLAPGGTPHQQRNLPVCLGLTRQVVVDDQRVLALEHEVLCHGAAAVGGHVLQRGRIAGPRHDHRGVLHSPLLAEHLDQTGNGRFLLADGHVEAVYVGVFLVDDRIDADGRLARLAVADDQLALSAADGRHRVDGLDTRLQRLLDRLALGHADRNFFDRPSLGRLDRSAAVQRVSQRVEHAPLYGLAHRHGKKLAGAANLVAFVDREEVAQDDHPHGVLFQVEGQAVDAAGKFDHLAGHHAGEAVDAGNPVAHFDHLADLADVDPGLVPFNLLLDHGSDLVGFEFHGRSCQSSVDGHAPTGWRCSRRKRYLPRGRQYHRSVRDR